MDDIDGGFMILGSSIAVRILHYQMIVQFLVKSLFYSIGASQFQLKQRWVVLVPFLPHVVYRGHQGALISGIIWDKQDFPASQASEHIRNTPTQLRAK